MTTIKIFKPNPKQIIGRKILHSPQYTDILFDGGKRCGKTVLICYDFLQLATHMQFAGIRQLMVREKFNHAKMSLWYQTLQPMIRNHFPGMFTTNKTDFIITCKHTGSEIWIGGLDDKDRTEKIFGQEFARIFNNEAVQSSPASCQKLESILAQNVPGFKNQIIYDCNPRSPAHFIYRKFYLNKAPHQIKLTWTPFDNIENLPAGYIDRLNRLSETEKKRYLHGEWCNVEGAVYTNIFEKNKRDCNKDWPPYDYVVGGIDWGYHAAATVWGVKENKACCLYGWSVIGGRTKDLIKKLDSVYWLKDHVVFYCDHEPDRIEELCEAGYMGKKAFKEVSAGDSTVNSYELYFDHETEAVFQSMLNLMREQDKDGNYTDKHVKVNDHEADSSRYSLHSARMEYGGDAEITLPDDYTYDIAY
jgi:phage terminase large subunit